jgi:GT2 family glycosyltransferase
MPRSISIIVPCRNGAATIARLVNALCELELPNGWRSEILVGYQNSEDNTLSILQNLPVKLVYSQSLGPAAARNHAAAMATGDLLWFIDADAWPAEPRFLTRLERHLKSINFPGSIGGPILLSKQQLHNPVAVADHLACWFCWLPGRSSGETTLFQPTTSVIILRTVFDEVGGFDENISVLEDFEIQQRIIENGYRLYYFDDLEVYHMARSTLFTSWRHSWGWGIPYRWAYLERNEFWKKRIILPDRWFWLSVPVVFILRWIRVLRMGWRYSPLLILYSLPFSMATVFAWALAVGIGGSHCRKPAE